MLKFLAEKILMEILVKNIRKLIEYVKSIKNFSKNYLLTNETLGVPYGNADAEQNKQEIFLFLETNL